MVWPVWPYVRSMTFMTEWSRHQMVRWVGHERLAAWLDQNVGVSDQIHEVLVTLW